MSHISWSVCEQRVCRCIAEKTRAYSLYFNPDYALQWPDNAVDIWSVTVHLFFTLFLIKISGSLFRPSFPAGASLFLEKCFKG